MSQRVIVDTGPLVALLNRTDRFHAWAKQQTAALEPPMMTCEAVIAEAWHLLRLSHPGREAIVDMIREDILSLPFQLAAEAAAVRQLVSRYRNVPMSLADACLVRMAELHSDSRVLTLDSDFSIYRKNGRQVIPLISP